MKPIDGRHLVDDQMIAVYIGAEPRFGRRTRTLSRHLEGCLLCARRYEAFAQQMTDLRDDATAEADEIFTPAKLEAQRLMILQRLEHASHPARVIPFPAHGTPNLSIFTGTQVRRWSAVAAAAGLILGLTLGRMTDFAGQPRVREADRTPAPVTRPIQTARPATETPNANDVEILMSRIQQAQGELQVPPELEALGGMTLVSFNSMSLPPGR